MNINIEGTPGPYTGAFRTHPNFKILFPIGLTLIVSAGYLNAVAVYGVFGYALTHLSGLTSGTAIKLVIGDFFMVMTFVFDIISYGLGSFTSTLLISSNKFTVGRQYAAGFILQSIVLYLVAADVLYFSKYYAQFLICYACGVQNGMTSMYSTNILRTTHVTGLLNDSFLITGHYVRSRDPKELWRVGVFGSLYLGFFIGSLLGAWAWVNIQAHCLWAPASYALFWGVLIFILKGFNNPVQDTGYEPV